MDRLYSWLIIPGFPIFPFLSPRTFIPFLAEFLCNIKFHKIQKERTSLYPNRITEKCIYYRSNNNCQEPNQNFHSEFPPLFTTITILYHFYPFRRNPSKLVDFSVILVFRHLVSAQTCKTAVHDHVMHGCFSMYFFYSIRRSTPFSPHHYDEYPLRFPLLPIHLPAGYSSIPPFQRPDERSAPPAGSRFPLFY